MRILPRHLEASAMQVDRLVREQIDDIMTGNSTREYRDGIKAPRTFGTWYDAMETTSNATRLAGHIKNAHGGKVDKNCNACRELSR